VKVLFIGGTGIISSACTELCVEEGIDLTLLNRGKTNRPVPENLNIFKADIRNPEEVKSILKNDIFDVVVDWIAYTGEHVKNDYDIFKDRISQYIFISSASVYQKPPDNLPIKETEPLINPFWEYSRNKIYCEQYLVQMFEEQNFPVTIVRPSHTYDHTKIALSGGYTALHRICKGKKVIIHGDGTSLWTLTHHRDFASGFVGLMGNSKAIGEAYHITSDEVLTWNQICQVFANEVGVQANIVHIPSDFIYRFDKEWGDGLLGDKSHCLIFDNQKIKKINPEFQAKIPFKEGAKEIVAWYDEDPERRVIDQIWDSKMDEIIKRYESLSG
jgi:nucleoside-diphosphate-sugar epimerase